MGGFLFFLFSFISVSLFLFAIINTIYKQQLTVQTRMKSVFGNLETSSNVNKGSSLYDMQLQKLWNHSKQLVDKKTPRHVRKDLEQRLQEAGKPYSLTPITFRLVQFILAGGLFTIVLLLFGPGSSNVFTAILAATASGILGIKYPEFYLSKKKKKRVQEIQKGMPDFFDMLNLTIEAGMGLDAALVKVCKKLGGPISEEFMRAIEDMKLGKSRREAFTNLRKRVPSEQFQSVLTALIQADQLGIGMAKVLRSLTQRIREKRRESAREQAMKAPVKMLFPMVFFIFPSIFIVILGPLVVYFVVNGLG